MEKRWNILNADQANVSVIEQEALKINPVICKILMPTRIGTLR